MRGWPSRRIALTILCAYALLGIIYGVMTPLFEAPDEAYHFPYIVHLAAGKGLPRQSPDELGAWEQEGSQPPLYYLIASLLIRGIDIDDLDAVRRLNPHARIGIPLANDNKNMVVHTPAEGFPWHGAALGVHVVRWFSLLLGLGTVWWTYRLARMLFPKHEHLALGTMALVAFNPMFLFVSSSVNNDNLITLEASLLLVLLAQRVMSRAGRHHTLLIGMLVGLACLTKLSGLALLPLVGGALALGRWLDGLPSRELAAARQALASDWYHLVKRDVPPIVRTRARTRLRHGLSHWLAELGLVLALTGLVAGWWYVRNMVLYGDPLGLATMLDIFGRRTGSETLASLVAEFRGFRYSFWGLFGWVNVLMGPRWLYALFDLLLLVAIVGLFTRAIQAWRRGTSVRWPIWLVLGMWTLGVVVSLLRWTSTTYASQGRLVFPAIAAISAAIMLGLSSLFPPRVFRKGVGALSVALCALALTVPFAIIAPTYARPASLTERDIPESATRFDTTYGDAMRLIAFEVEPKVIAPGDTLKVTLYWQALDAIEEDYSIYIHVFGFEGQLLGQRDTYHGRGLYPSSLWTEGEVIRDTFEVPIREDANGPVAAEVIVGLYRWHEMDNLPARDGLGRIVGKPVLCRIKLTGDTPPTRPSIAINANLDHRVVLTGYDLETSLARSERTLSVDLHWYVTAPLGGQYAVFVHLLDEDDTIVTQGDGPPMGGQYPTQFWSAGEYLVDRHIMLLPETLPEGNLSMYVGLYHRETQQRLPIIRDDGAPPSDRVPLGTLPAWLTTGD